MYFHFSCLVFVCCPYPTPPFDFQLLLDLLFSYDYLIYFLVMLRLDLLFSYELNQFVNIQN